MKRNHWRRAVINNETMKTDSINLAEAAELLGYQRIEWDSNNGCYSGYGSNDPYDRSRGDIGGSFISWNYADFQNLISRSR